MESSSGGLDRQHVDVEGETIVETPKDLFLGEAFLGLQVGNLRERMNTGVGSARAADRNLGFEQFPRRARERSRNRAIRVFLRLPAAIAGAVVFERQLPCRHRRKLSKNRRAR